MKLYQSILKYRNSNAPAIYFENKTITYKTLTLNIQKMIHYFQTKNIKKDDVVTLVLPNIPIVIYAFYALNALGVKQNILHPLTTFPNIIKSMREVNSHNVILLGTLYKGNKKECLKNNDINFFFANACFDNSIFMKDLFSIKYGIPKNKGNIYNIDYFRTYNYTFEVSVKDIDEDSIYLHSGGTTGTSKIIVLSDDAFNNLSLKVDGIIDDTKGKSMLAVLPTFHGFGLGMGIHAPLSRGCTICLMMKFNVKKVIKYINQNKINYIIGIPRLYEKLLKNKKFLKANLKNLDYAFIGGDNVPVSLINKYNETMEKVGSISRMYEGYGLTETVTVCTVNTKTNYKIGSVGKGLIGIDIKIKDDDLNDLKPNEIGEVFISGNTLMCGYLSDEKTTKETMIELDGKTWIRTGDMGYLDEDGFLFIKGRKKRIIKISGINVFPNEVESVACEFKEVDSAALVYFDNERPHMNLYIIKSNINRLTDDELTNKIYAALKEKFIKYSLPARIIYLDTFPRTKVGKIDYKSFKE